MSESEKRVRLNGGPEHTTTWVYLNKDGSLVVEWYDHSDDAESAFGNDVAFLLTVAAPEKAKLHRLLAGEQENGPGMAVTDDALLSLMQERFDSYFTIKQWFEANAVSFETSFDSWA